MNITFNLDILGWRISTFDVRIDLDKGNDITKPVVDRGVKRMTRWWTEHMAS
jgi:hypothetical protein